MFRRGLPAALFGMLALGGIYWMLRARTDPAAKSPAAAADVGSSESERSAGAPPVSAQTDRENQAAETAAAELNRAEQAAEQPVVRALKPAPATVEAAKAPKPSAAAGAGKAPAARADGAAPSSPSELRDAKSTRPKFLNTLEGQDYGGRE